MAILEILMASIVLAVAIVGIALMFSEGQSYAVADGDDRVALALAQHKLEDVRSLGFFCIPAPVASSASDAIVALDATLNAGCPDTTATQDIRRFNEPASRIALSFGTTPATPTASIRYTSRVTTITCVDAVTFTSPGSGCDNAKLIRVEVTPIMGKARGVRVETVMTAH